MALVCPQCKQLYEATSVCPLCNVVLLFHAENLQSEPPSVPPAQRAVESPQWQQTPVGKIVIGLVVAQGLSFGCEQLLMAGFLASGDGANVWTTLWGIVTRHSIAAVSLLLGGALSGAGQSRGILYGSIVGLTSGIIAIAFRNPASEMFSTMLIYAAPVIYLATGALGGALGMLIWRPLPMLPELSGNTPTPAPSLSFGSSLDNLFVGPIHIGRVCAGAFVIVAGVVWSRAILEFLLRASNGTLTISSTLQAQLVSLEISALMALIGAGFAGATTSNGLKQGLCVGLGASIIVLGIQFGNPKFSLESAVFTISGIVVVSLVGGWFGSQLFPKIDPNRRRRRYS